MDNQEAYQEAYKELAIGMIQSALEDLRTTKKSEKVAKYRREAYFFLRPKNKTFCYWCDVIGTEPEFVLEKIKKEYADDFKRVFNEIYANRPTNKSVAV